MAKARTPATSVVAEQLVLAIPAPEAHEHREVSWVRKLVELSETAFANKSDRWWGSPCPGTAAPRKNTPSWLGPQGWLPGCLSPTATASGVFHHFPVLGTSSGIDTSLSNTTRTARNGSPAKGRWGWSRARSRKRAFASRTASLGN